MTTIAWDGKTLAADKRTSFGCMHATVTKVHRMPIGPYQGALVAGAGPALLIQEMLRWIATGAEPQTFPAANRNEDKCCCILMVTPEGRLLYFDSTPDPMTIENEKWAIGSGRDFAMAAMFLGKDAIEAVVIASALDISTGNGFDSLTLMGQS